VGDPNENASRQNGTERSPEKNQENSAFLCQIGTREGKIAGTPQSMSPEQARGDAVDQRSDLFSLGSVLYTLCTVRPPFRAESSYGVMRPISDHAPTPIGELNPDIPGRLSDVIGKRMAKEKANRFASASEVHKVLEACLSHVQQPTAARLPQRAAWQEQLATGIEIYVQSSHDEVLVRLGCMIPRPDGTDRFFVHSGCRRSVSGLQVFKIRPGRGTPPTDDAAMVSDADGSVFENDAVRLVVERDGAIRIRQPRTRCWLSAILTCCFGR
jgi:serine/threonine protein kinase